MVLTLYSFPPSAPARAALLTARSVGVDITVKNINVLKKEQFNDEEFLKLNPQHCVPTLVDGDFVLWESRAIAGYLVQQYASNDSLYPKNPQLKAVVDQRLYFDCCTLWPRIRAVAFPILYLGETTISEDKKKTINEALGFLEKFLHGRKWVTGDTVTIADLALYASVSSLVAIGLDISNFKNVVTWLKECQTLPGADENEAGAKEYGELVRSKVAPGQIP